MFGFLCNSLVITEAAEYNAYLFLFSFEVHARRIQALKALTYAPSSNSEILSRLYEIVFGLLDKVCPAPTFTISLASSSVLHFFNC